MLGGISDLERQSLRERGWARAVGAIPATVLDGLVAEAAGAVWTATAGDGFSLETAAAGPSGADLGLQDIRLIRHRPGDYGLPPLGAGVGVVIDLNTDWPSRHGGLLLVAEGDGLRGWRPEPGAVTLFDAARPPTLTLVAPAAAGPRLALIGRLQEA